ncbi:hypothetical protein SGLAM104S_01666 [Streptomyces glaucescens]
MHAAAQPGAGQIPGGVVIGLESLGIPLPGEIILVSSALLASQHGDIDPVILGACATAGAIIGDSIGYAIGRKGGRPLLAWLGGKFPRHFSEGHIATAERSFEKRACGPSSSAGSSPCSGSSPAAPRARCGCRTGSSSSPTCSAASSGRAAPPRSSTTSAWWPRAMDSQRFVVGRPGR